MQRLMWCVLFLAFAVTVQAKVVTKEVTYTADGLNLKGYLAYDDAQSGKRPGVLVVHEWWGQNDYIRKRARMLAELGYVALALDMYGEGKQATHPEDASKFSSEVMKNLDVAEQRFMAGLALLKQQPQTNKQQIAAIGYCFGGGVVLAMARRGVDLKGVASFHGSLGAGAPAAPGKVKAKVLVLNGADDPFVKPEQIAAFKEEMTAAGVDYEFVNYPGAKHSFTNPAATENGKKFQLPLEYNAEADKESWQKLQSFFKQIFK
ncbi:MAG: dienelactone hydrolase family protein [Gammaproteobacteria bacterium]